MNKSSCSVSGRSYHCFRHSLTEASLSRGGEKGSQCGWRETRRRAKGREEGQGEVLRPGRKLSVALLLLHCPNTLHCKTHIFNTSQFFVDEETRHILTWFPSLRVCQKLQLWPQLRLDWKNIFSQVDSYDSGCHLDSEPGFLCVFQPGHCLSSLPCEPLYNGSSKHYLIFG